MAMETLLIVFVIIYHVIIIFYITSLCAVKKIHVKLGISSCWHNFHCVGWA